MKNKFLKIIVLVVLVISPFLLKINFVHAETITRVQAAVEIKNILGIPTTSCASPYPTNPFTDISGNTAAEKSAIEDLWQAGITFGCGSNAYCPNTNLTRADAAVFVNRVSRFWDGSSLDFSSTIFSDLPLSSSNDKSFFYMINTAYRKMFSAGTQISIPPTFDPLSPVDRNTFLGWLNTAASKNNATTTPPTPNSNKLLTFESHLISAPDTFNIWGMTPTHCTNGSTLCNTGENLVNRVEIKVNCSNWLPADTYIESPQARNTWGFGNPGSFYGLLNSPGQNNLVFVRMFGKDINNYGVSPLIATAWDEFLTPVPLPDLVAYTPEQSTATVGVPTVLSSTIANWGNGDTGASFSNFFQVATASNGGGTITDLASTTMTALAAGANNTATKSYTFTSAGTYSVRACADKTNRNDTGVIAELDETNNCSTTWKNVTVTDAVVTPMPDLTAATPSPTTATVNLPVSLSSVITNTGTASTGASFSNFFQVATASNGGGTITDLASTTMTALAAGANNTATKSYTFTSAGTYSVRACADKTNRNDTGVIAELDETNNCSTWIDILVSSSPRPDLTASAPDQTTATLGVSVSFSSTISNGGLASTGAAFSNFFQVATDSNGGGSVTDLNPTSMNALNPGLFNTTSQSYTFNSVGTYSLRACADKTNRNDTGVITELNEANNCSGWTNVAVSAANVCVPNQGNDCISAPNGCGQISSGSIQCNGSCSASTPPTPSPCPVCANGATNPPLCTLGGDTCLNGATNPPLCTTVDDGKGGQRCVNGSSNPPTCQLKKPIFKEN